MTAPPAASDPVAALVAAVAAGEVPPVDGRVRVLAPTGRLSAVLAFTGHHVVVADVDPAWVHERLPEGDMAAPMAAPFLDALGARIGRRYDNLDLVLVAPGLAGPPSLPLVEVDPDVDHPRAARARRYRDDVRAWEHDGGRGLLVVGRGLGGRWEAAFEVGPAARGAGLGRALATAARHLVPEGEALFVQVSPGNAASLRAVLGAGGFRPVGGEALFPPAPA
ncbi:MAG: hypothetical protein U0P45_02560 [Acidimicrobiales bacterium]